MRQNAHNKRNLLLCLVGAFALFLIGSTTVLAILPTAPLGNLARATDRGILIIQMTAYLTAVVCLIAIPSPDLLPAHVPTSGVPHLARKHHRKAD